MTLRQRRTWFALGGASVALAGIFAYSTLPGSLRVRYGSREHHGLADDKREALNQMFDGESGIETIKHPDSVEAFRIGVPSSRVGGDERRVENYPILAGPIHVPREMQAVLFTALASPDSYVWETLKGCLPEFGVCLSFYRNRERIDVFLCFECDILMVTHNGEVNGGEDFDHIHATLVRAVKQLFPADRVIQEL